MNIAVDLDETICDQLGQLLLFHNETYGTFLKKDDFLSEYEKTWGGTKKEAIAKVRAFMESNYFLNIKPIPGAFEALLLLKQQGHKLFIVTGREYRIREITQMWVEKYFPGIFSGIYYTNAYMDGEESIKKSVICKEIGASVIIEDDLMHILDCLEFDIKAIVLNAPRNTIELPDGAIRINFLIEAVEVIKYLSSVN